MTETLNANIADCLRTAHHIGFNRVYNICDGSVHDIVWGGGDWVFAALATSFAAACIVIFASITVMVVRD